MEPPGRGTTIECKDAIFVMTSNLAADEIAAYGVEPVNLKSSHLDLGCAPYVLYGAKYIGPVTLAPPNQPANLKSLDLGLAPCVLYGLNI